VAVEISPYARRVAEILVAIKAIACDPTSSFTLPGGHASPVYVDVRRLAFLSEYREILRWLAESVRVYPFDAVAGGEAAGISFAGALAELVGLPFATEFRKGHAVLWVDDVVTDGGAQIGGLQRIRAAGGTCEHAVVALSYGLFPLKDMGLTLHALTTWSHVLEVAESRGYFDAAQLQAIRAFELTFMPR
jgi:orotate phosphoribosyltransferase